MCVFLPMPSRCCGRGFPGESAVFTRAGVVRQEHRPRAACESLSTGTCDIGKSPGSFSGLILLPGGAWSAQSPILGLPLRAGEEHLRQAVEVREETCPAQACSGSYWCNHILPKLN